MFISPAQSSDLRLIISQNLDLAETYWDEVGQVLKQRSLSEALKANQAQPSRIPGYPLVEPGIPIVDEFIALVADMRDSSKHLMQAISKDKAKVSELQRVYYETSALIPGLASTISYQNGNVTEYLGDGILALFRVTQDSPEESIKAAYRAASDCIGIVRDVVNGELAERYSLPPIDVGVGLAISRAMVTLVGIDEYFQPKIIGECVYRATKLSKGRNEVTVDKRLYTLWPKSQGGRLKFRPKPLPGNLEGYVVGVEG